MSIKSPSAESLESAISGSISSSCSPNPASLTNNSSGLNRDNSSPNASMTRKKSNGSMGGDPRQVLQAVLAPEYQERLRQQQELDQQTKVGSTPSSPSKFTAVAIPSAGDPMVRGHHNNNNAGERETSPLGDREVTPILVANISSLSTPTSTGTCSIMATPVKEWLQQHQLSQYTKALTSEGFDDLEDLRELAFSKAEEDPQFEVLFRKLVPAAGHQAKIRRLLSAMVADAENHSFPRATPLIPFPTAPPPAIAEAGQLPSQAAAPHLFVLRDEGSPDPSSPGATRESGGVLSNAGGEDEQRVIVATPPSYPSLATQDERSTSLRSPPTGAGRSTTPNGRPLNFLSTPNRGAGGGAYRPRSASRINRSPAEDRAKRDAADGRAHLNTTPGKTATGPLFPDSSRSDISESGPLNSFSFMSTTSLPRVVRKPSGIDLGSEPISVKVIIVGAPSVGKTSFVRRLVNNEFISKPQPTIGIDYFSKKFKVGDSTIVTMQLWDVWGQDSFNQISRSVLIGAKGALILYDVLDGHSLNVAAKWKQELDRKSGANCPGGTLPCVLVGNKDDLDGKRVLGSKSAVQDYCNRMKFMDHQFASAKSGDGVQDAAEFLLTAILKGDPSITGAQVVLKPTLNGKQILTLDEKMRPQSVGSSKNSKRSNDSLRNTGKKKSLGSFCTML